MSINNTVFYTTQASFTVYNNTFFLIFFARAADIDQLLFTTNESNHDVNSTFVRRSITNIIK